MNSTIWAWGNNEMVGDHMTIWLILYISEWVSADSPTFKNILLYQLPDYEYSGTSIYNADTIGAI